MTRRDKRTLCLRWAETLLTVLTLALAVMLAAQCVHIYAMGNAPENLTEEGVRINPVYSRQIVADALRPVRLPALAWLVLLAVCAAGRAACPVLRRPAVMEPEIRLRLQAMRHGDTEAIRKERGRRRKARTVCALFCVVCAVGAGTYLLNMEHFTSWDLETVMGQMLLHVAPWTLAAFAALMALAAWEKRSVLRELEAMKTAPAKPAASCGGDRQTPGAVRVALYAAAVALIVAGIFNGGMYDVLVKAINICTECIGLG